MIAETLQQVMTGGINRTVGLTEHPFLSMYVTNLGDRPGLLIDVDLPAGSAIDDGQGFDIVEISGGARERVLIRPTRSGTASPAFLGLVEFVFRETARAADRSAAIVALLDAVHEFRQFFARRTDRLNESAVRGLTAEMHLLLELVGAGMSPVDALQAWSGPFRGTDFRFADASGIEVKSTRNPPQSVQISSEHQLVSDPGGLHLFVLPLATLASEDAGGISFLDTLSAAKSALLVTPDARAIWDSAIEALGLDDTDPYYRQWRFAQSDWLAFTVSDEFPRIIPTILSTGIKSVSYAIEISALEPFREEFRTVVAETAATYA